MEDNFDLAVFFFCAAGLIGFVCIEVGQYIQMQKKTYCADSLADGRQLTTAHLSHAGHTQCTYAPAYGAKKYRKG